MKTPEHNKDLNAIMELIYSARAEGREEMAKAVKKNIGFLRQWLNEKPTDLLISNHHIEVFLEIDSLLTQINKEECE